MFLSLYFGMLGIFCVYYYGKICRHCGYAPDFSWLWSSIGTVLVIWAVIIGADWIKDGMGRKVLYGGTFLVTLLILVFVFCLFMILSKNGKKKASAGADYLILLGAKVNGTVPSAALKSRIETAFLYLKENPGTTAILSGGQGKEEEISEAAAMERELLKLGIEKGRLRMEDKSTTTLENITFSSGFIHDKGKRIVIVTSDFHTLRGKAIAEDCGFTKVETLGAPSSKTMRLHYYTREACSWMKYFVRAAKGN